MELKTSGNGAKESRTDAKQVGILQKRAWERFWLPVPNDFCALLYPWKLLEKFHCRELSRHIGLQEESRISLRVPGPILGFGGLPTFDFEGS